MSDDEDDGLEVQVIAVKPAVRLETCDAKSSDVIDLTDEAFEEPDFNSGDLHWLAALADRAKIKPIKKLLSMSESQASDNQVYMIRLP